jgi:hypothetical protein
MALKQVIKRFVILNMHRFLAFFLLFNVLLVTIATAQDTLPKFSLSAKANGKVLINWHNNFVVVTQISIQRSYDSLKNFTTILTVPDPAIPENGFVDTKAPGRNMFYRLFIVLENGNYLFSKSKRAKVDSGLIAAKNIAADNNDNSLSRIDNQRITYLNDQQKMNVNVPATIQDAPKIEIARIVFVKQNDSVIAQLSSPIMVRKFRDSILNKTKDTLVFESTDTILVKAFVPKEVYKISAYVFTGKDGNIIILLPDADKKKYMVKFLEQDLSTVLEIKDIKKTPLIVDKTNFVHAGWFRFELYEDGKLKEKNKFFIPKDF